jgi:hypothetical protein
VVGTEAFHYEVAEMMHGRIASVPHEGPRLCTPDEFLCSNFTVDLCVESTDGTFTNRLIFWRMWY